RRPVGRPVAAPAVPVADRPVGRRLPRAGAVAARRGGPRRGGGAGRVGGARGGGGAGGRPGGARRGGGSRRGAPGRGAGAGRQAGASGRGGGGGTTGRAGSGGGVGRDAGGGGFRPPVTRIRPGAIEELEGQVRRGPHRLGARDRRGVGGEQVEGRQAVREL